jgi:hypothetical protein
MKKTKTINQYVTEYNKSKDVQKGPTALVAFRIPLSLKKKYDHIQATDNRQFSKMVKSLLADAINAASK